MRNTSSLETHIFDKKANPFVHSLSLINGKILKRRHKFKIKHFLRIIKYNFFCNLLIVNFRLEASFNKARGGKVSFLLSKCTCSCSSRFIFFKIKSPAKNYRVMVHFVQKTKNIQQNITFSAYNFVLLLRR